MKLKSSKNKEKITTAIKPELIQLEASLNKKFGAN